MSKGIRNQQKQINISIQLLIQTLSTKFIIKAFNKESSFYLPTIVCQFPPLFRGACRRSDDSSMTSEWKGSEKIYLWDKKNLPVIQTLRLFSCFVGRRCCNVFQLHVYHITRPGNTLLFSIWNTEETTASVVYWSEFMATDTEVPGSIPGATRFSE
jgi:hypothetical protein